MRIFLSSTIEDLKKTRKEIETVIRQAGWDTRQMEYFSAQPTDGLETSKREVRDADLMILVIANRYGYVDPASRKSITHHEFLEARRCEIPILPFVVSPKSGDDPRTPELEAFIREVGKTETYTKVDDLAHVPAAVLAALIRHVNEHGKTGRSARVFPDYETFFADFLNQAAAFNHRHGLEGRTDELATLQSFLASDKLACVVDGIGGSGKSKLLYELAIWCSQQGREQYPEMRFFRVGLPLTADAFRELPARNVCVVIDDAHRVQQLESLVEACRSYPSVSKLLLTARPGAIGTADRALRSIPESRIERIALHPLEGRTDAMALAMKSLAPEVQEQAERLVAVADGNPLIITVGASLLSSSMVSADLLQQREEFIRAALGHLLDAMPATLRGGIARDELLGVLSAIQPFAPSDPDLTKRVAVRLDVLPSSVTRAIDTLRQHGLLLERGNLARITPDVLGDHILYEQAVTSTKASTGFIDELVVEFGDTHMANILLNGAELDWRTEAADDSESVLGRVWLGITESLHELSHRGRQTLLRSLQRPAVFAPGRVFSVVEWCIEHDNAPEDDDPVTAALKIGQLHVRDTASELLGIIGRHPDFAEPCAIHLWNLTRNDNRNPNPRPEHPIRLLRDLATYRTDNDLRTIEGVLRGIEQLVQRGEHTSSVHDICEIIGESLGREVEHRVSNARTLTLSARSLAMNAVRPQRDRALRLLQRIGEGHDLKAAAHAIHYLSVLLCVPHFKFGRETTEADLVAFLPEAISVVQILSSIAINAPFQAIRYLARRPLIEIDVEEWPALAGPAESALAEVPEPADVMIFDSLLDKGVQFTPRADLEAQQKAASLRRHETVKALWESESSATQIVERIAPVIDDLDQMHHHYEVFLFFDLAKAATSEQRVKALARAIINSKSPCIRQLTHVALRILREQGLIDEFIDALSALAEADDPKSRRIAANGLKWCLYGGEEPGDRELELVRRFIDDTDPAIRAAALQSLGRFANTIPEAAIALLVSSTWGDAPVVAERALSCLGKGYGIDPALLSNEGIKTLVWKLRDLRSIDERNHAISRFLEFASTREPMCLVQMLLARIDDSTQPGSSFSDGFRPIPHVGNALRLAHIQDPELRLAILRRIRDHALNSSWQHAEFVPRLFAAFVSDLNDAVTVCMEWGLTDDEVKVRAASKILRAMSAGVIWIAHAQFADMLDNAKRLSGECYRRVGGDLHTVALIKGARWIDPDNPDPQLVAQAKQADELAIHYQGRPAVADFFQSLGDSARKWIEIDHERLDEEPL